jgi:hypothetical protein
MAAALSNNEMERTKSALAREAAAFAAHLGRSMDDGQAHNDGEGHGAGSWG